MQRIYLPHILFSETLEIKDSELYHQLTRVLRARVGQEVIFFDGKNMIDFLYEIIGINKVHVVLELKEKIVSSSELHHSIALYQALPNKLEKLEYIIQKTCEVGYKKIVFFPSERSQKLILSEKKKDRIRKIAIEAIEQCGGNIIPEIVFSEDSFSFEGEKIQERVAHGEKLFFCHTVSQNSKMLSEISFLSSEKVSIFVGPEGGFSDNEVKAFEDNNMTRINFGNRILRSETVAEVLGFYISQQKK